MLTYALHHTEYVMYGMIYCKYNGEMKSAVPGTADRNKENAKANVMSLGARTWGLYS